MVSLSISISWLDFLPGGGLRSPGHWIFTQNGNFVKDVTGRNKKYQKYQLWAYNEFIIPPSSRALALHALIISLKPSGKIVKLQNECTEFSHNEEFRSKIFKMSFNFDLKTSCALPPYYSLELSLISSTSHFGLTTNSSFRLRLELSLCMAKLFHQTGSASSGYWNLRQWLIFLLQWIIFSKNINLYKLWPGHILIIPPSSGALALHAQIISLG